MYSRYVGQQIIISTFGTQHTLIRFEPLLSDK